VEKPGDQNEKRQSHDVGLVHGGRERGNERGGDGQVSGLHEPMMMPDFPIATCKLATPKGERLLRHFDTPMDRKTVKWEMKCLN